jgi:hypothetical protein
MAKQLVHSSHWKVLKNRLQVVPLRQFCFKALLKMYIATSRVENSAQVSSC